MSMGKLEARKVLSAGIRAIGTVGTVGTGTVKRLQERIDVGDGNRQVIRKRACNKTGWGFCGHGL